MLLVVVVSRAFLSRVDVPCFGVGGAVGYGCCDTRFGFSVGAGSFCAIRGFVSCMRVCVYGDACVCRGLCLSVSVCVRLLVSLCVCVVYNAVYMG